MERSIEIIPAYDHGSGGAHGVDLRMLVSSPAGTVQFLIFTQKYLVSTVRALLNRQPTYSGSGFDKAVLSYCGRSFTKGKELQEIMDYDRAIIQINGTINYMFSPMAADLGYHSPRPMYNGQMPTGVHGVYDDDYNQIGYQGYPSPCKYINNKAPCYYDGSGLAADRLYSMLKNIGEEAVWKELEKYHQETFERELL